MNPRAAAAAALATASLLALRRLITHLRRRPRATHADCGPTIAPPGVKQRLDEIAPSLPASAAASSDQCPYCLDTFARGALVRVAPCCGKALHARCLEKWTFYRAALYLSQRNWSIREDGRVEETLRGPVCPWCAACLDVITNESVRHTIGLSVMSASQAPMDVLSMSADFFF